MFRYLLILLLQLELLRGNVVSNEGPDREMVLAFVVNRHGERAPDSDELALSDQQEKLRNLTYIEGLEGLTIAGKRRAYQIGKFIRQRYGWQGYGLLSKIYMPSEIEIRSTDKERTKMTAEIAMAAVFPPETEEQWDEGLGRVWQPVPYKAIPLSEDYLRYYSNCQNFKDLMATAKTTAIQEEFHQFKDLVSLVMRETGKDFSEDPLQFQTLFDLFRSTVKCLMMLTFSYYSLLPAAPSVFIAVSVSLGLDIPEWAKPLLPKLGEAAKLAYRLYFKNDEMKKIGGGVLLNDFVEAASKISSGKRVTKRFRMFSGHDFNIGSLMEVTKVIRHEQSNPEYGSMFALELYRSRKTGEYTVVPVYLPRAGASSVQLLHFSFCEHTTHCSLERFIEKTKEYVLSERDFYNICNIRTEL